MTPDVEQRSRRALAAARRKFQAGALDDALRLLTTAETGALSDLQRAQVDLLRAETAFAATRGRPLGRRLTGLHNPRRGQVLEKSRAPARTGWPYPLGRGCARESSSRRGARRTASGRTGPAVLPALAQDRLERRFLALTDEHLEQRVDVAFRREE